MLPSIYNEFHDSKAIDYQPYTTLATYRHLRMPCSDEQEQPSSSYSLGDGK